MRAGRIRAFFTGEKGSALLYAMLAVAALSIVGMEIISRGSRGTVYVQDEQLKAAREKLYRRVNAIASIEDSLFTSLNDPANGALRQCLTPGAGCGGFSFNARMPLTLYSPEGQLVAGTAANPVLYDRNGIPCGANCVFAAYAYFWSGCKGGGGGCSFPDNIYTLVQIQSTGVSVLGLAVPASMPKDTEIQRSVQSYTNTLVASKVTKTQVVCPPGTSQVQYNQGQISCQCTTGTQTGTDANGYPICSVSTPSCPGSQIFIGLNAQGQASCAPVGQTNCYWAQGYNEQRCTINGCTEAHQLVMDCSRTGGVYHKMTSFGNQPQLCNQIAAPNKKSNPMDFGTYQCFFTYNYQCCEY